LQGDFGARRPEEAEAATGEGFSALWALKFANRALEPPPAACLSWQNPAPQLRSRAQCRYV
jgi:hypothetical protein